MDIFLVSLNPEHAKMPLFGSVMPYILIQPKQTRAQIEILRKMSREDIPDISDGRPSKDPDI
jgi:hypothetical protein